MRYEIKGGIVIFLYLFTWPFILASLIAYKYFSSEGIFSFSAQLLSIIPGKIGQYIRTSFYSLTIEECKYDLMVGFCSFFAHPTARVGRRVGLGCFSLVGTAHISDNVLISSRVSILSGKYQHGSPSNEPLSQDPVKYRVVKIKSGVWLGEGSVVMADIGKNCIVSAGSVVTKDMPDNYTAIGNPARFLKNQEPKKEEN